MARLNEISGRCSVLTDDFYVPAPEQVSFQSANKPEGCRRKFEEMLTGLPP